MFMYYNPVTCGKNYQVQVLSFEPNELGMWCFTGIVIDDTQIGHPRKDGKWEVYGWASDVNIRPMIRGKRDTSY